MGTKTEIKNLTLAELERELTRAKREYVKTSFLIRTGQSKAIHEGKRGKVYIAQVNTQITALKKQESLQDGLAKKEKQEENSAEKRAPAKIEAKEKTT